MSPALARLDRADQRVLAAGVDDRGRQGRLALARGQARSSYRNFISAIARKRSYQRVEKTLLSCFYLSVSNTPARIAASLLKQRGRHSNEAVPGDQGLRFQFRRHRVPGE